MTLRKRTRRCPKRVSALRVEVGWTYLTPDVVTDGPYAGALPVCRE